MARKIIRDADREKAREESKKAAEAVPVKPVAVAVDCDHANAVLDVMSQVFNCNCGMSFTYKFALMNKLPCIGKAKPASKKVSPIASANDDFIDALKYAANPLSKYGSPVPSQFEKANAPITLDVLMKFCGKNGSLPDGENFRIDYGILRGEYLFFTDGKVVIRTCTEHLNYTNVEYKSKFGRITTTEAGHVVWLNEQKSGLYNPCGYVHGYAGCYGGDFASFPVEKMPFDWVHSPIKTAMIECAVDIRFDSVDCSKCDGKGCEACHGTGSTTSVNRVVFADKSGRKINIAPKHYELLKLLPDLSICRASTEQILRFSFHTTGGNRGYGMCVSPDAEELVKTKSKVKPSLSPMPSPSDGYKPPPGKEVDFAKYMEMKSKFDSDFLGVTVPANPLPIETLPYNGDPNANTKQQDHMADSIAYWQGKAAKMEAAFTQQLFAKKTEIAAEVAQEFGIPDDKMFGPSTIMGGMANKPKPKLPKMED